MMGIALALGERTIEEVILGTEAGEPVMYAVDEVLYATVPCTAPPMTVGAEVVLKKLRDPGVHEKFLGVVIGVIPGVYFFGAEELSPEKPVQARGGEDEHPSSTSAEAQI